MAGFTTAAQPIAGQASSHRAWHASWNLPQGVGMRPGISHSCRGVLELFRLGKITAAFAACELLVARTLVDEHRSPVSVDLQVPPVQVLLLLPRFGRHEPPGFTAYQGHRRASAAGVHVHYRHPLHKARISLTPAPKCGSGDQRPPGRPSRPRPRQSRSACTAPWSRHPRQTRLVRWSGPWHRR